MNAPKLAGHHPWYLKRQLVNYKQGVRGTHEKDTHGKVMAPMAATLADEKAIDNVVAYIASLPDKRAASTIRGDARAGRDRYVSCGGCHGADGRGALATNAPRLQGMSDWYMATQLRNFRTGIRGGHPKDLHGSQMALFAELLRDDRAIADVLAYIDSLDHRPMTASAQR
jgi:cytochrome c oxidase subunit 2